MTSFAALEDDILPFPLQAVYLPPPYCQQSAMEAHRILAWLRKLMIQPNPSLFVELWSSWLPRLYWPRVMAKELTGGVWGVLLYEMLTGKPLRCRRIGTSCSRRLLKIN